MSLLKIEKSLPDIQTQKIKYTFTFPTCNSPISKTNIISLFKSLINIKENKTDKFIIATNNNITFYVTHIKSFDEYLKSQSQPINICHIYIYIHILKCIYDLSKQLDYFINQERKTPYQINPDNIWVIETTNTNTNTLPIFIYICQDPENEIKTINKKTQQITFNTLPFLLFGSSSSVSPELKNIKNIPASIHYKTVYYSLGLFIQYFINVTTPTPTSNENNNNKYSELEIKYLKSLNNFLEKSMNSTNPKERKIEWI